MNKICAFILVATIFFPSLGFSGEVGFRDLRIGVTADSFERLCKRQKIERHYICYEREDIVFEWQLPNTSMGWPDSTDKVTTFSIEFWEPYLKTLNLEKLVEEMNTPARHKWVAEKYASLRQDLSSKYKIMWSWDDPKAPNRASDELKLFNDDFSRTGLDTIFENGQVTLSYVKRGVMAPTVEISYRNQEIGQRWAESKGLVVSEVLKALPETTDHSEF